MGVTKCDVCEKDCLCKRCTKNDTCKWSTEIKCKVTTKCGKVKTVFDSIIDDVMGRSENDGSKF